MAFGARRHDDGTWRLCLRKGVTLDRAGNTQLVFSSQAKAQACAEALNDKFWDANKKAILNKQFPPDGWEMLELIKKFMQ